MVAAFVNMTGTLALGPFLPVIADELGTSVSVLGQVPAVVTLLATALGLFIGPLADRYGYRPTLVISLAAACFSTVGMALASGVVPLLMAGLLSAIGRAAVLPTSQAVAAARFQGDELRRAVSWIMTGHSSAALLGLPLLTFVAAFANWRVAFAGLGALALGMALLLLRTPMGSDGRGDVPLRFKSILAAYVPLRDHRTTRLLIGASFVGGTGTWAAVTYLGAFLAQRHGFTTSEIGWAYFGAGTGAVLGARVIGTRLGARPQWLLLVSRAAGGLLLGAALILPLAALVALPLLVLGVVADVVSRPRRRSRWRRYHPARAPPR